MKLVSIEEGLEMMDLWRPLPFRLDPIDALGTAQPIPFRIEPSFETTGSSIELFGCEDP